MSGRGLFDDVDDAEEIFATKQKPKEKEKTIFDDLENDTDDFLTQSEDRQSNEVVAGNADVVRNGKERSGSSGNMGDSDHGDVESQIDKLEEKLYASSTTYEERHKIRAQLRKLKGSSGRKYDPLGRGLSKPSQENQHQAENRTTRSPRNSPATAARRKKLPDPPKKDSPLIAKKTKPKKELPKPKDKPLFPDSQDDDDLFGGQKKADPKQEEQPQPKDEGVIAAAGVEDVVEEVIEEVVEEVIEVTDDEADVEGTVVEKAVVEEAVVEEAIVEEAVVEEADVEEAVVEEADVEEAALPEETAVKDNTEVSREEKDIVNKEVEEEDVPGSRSGNEEESDEIVEVMKEEDGEVTMTTKKTSSLFDDQEGRPDGETTEEEVRTLDQLAEKEEKLANKMAHLEEEVEFLSGLSAREKQLEEKVASLEEEIIALGNAREREHHLEAQVAELEEVNSKLLREKKTLALELSELTAQSRTQSKEIDELKEKISKMEADRKKQQKPTAAAEVANRSKVSNERSESPYLRKRSVEKVTKKPGVKEIMASSKVGTARREKSASPAVSRRVDTASSAVARRAEKSTSPVRQDRVMSPSKLRTAAPADPKPEVAPQKTRFFKSKLQSSVASGGSNQTDGKTTSKSTSMPDMKAAVQLREKKTPEPSPEPARTPEEEQQPGNEGEDTTRPRMGTAKRMSALWEEKATSTTTARRAQTVSDCRRSSHDSTPDDEVTDVKTKDPEWKRSVARQRAAQLAGRRSSDDVVSPAEETPTPEPRETEKELEKSSSPDDASLPEWKRELAAKRAGLRRTGEDETDKPVTRADTKKTELQENDMGLVKPSTPVESKKDLNEDSSNRKRGATSAAAFRSTPSTKCLVCDTTVYHMEKIEVDQKLFHKKCFKCRECGKTLSAGTYASLQGTIYCKPHFKQLFKLKGNYDEGFGREQHKTKWSS